MSTVSRLRGYASWSSLKKKKKSCEPIELVCWNIEVLFVKGSDKNVVVTRIYKNVNTDEGWISWHCPTNWEQDFLKSSDCFL